MAEPTLPNSIPELSIKTGGWGLGGAAGGPRTIGAKQDSSVCVKDDSQLCVAASLQDLVLAMLVLPSFLLPPLPTPPPAVVAAAKLPLPLETLR